jgi:hypothetical protein
MASAIEAVGLRPAVRTTSFSGIGRSPFGPTPLLASQIGYGPVRGTIFTQALILQPPVAGPRREPSEAGPLTASVGARGRNQTNDVRLVQRRLAELGFPIRVDGVAGPETARTISRFIAIARGEAHSQETLHANSLSATLLFSENAPRWQALGLSGEGWVRTDREGYHWAAGHTASTIDSIGKRYAAYMQQNPLAYAIAINDVSRADGNVLAGPSGSSEHDSHRNGLDVDIRLPRKRSAGGQYGTSVYWASYDREMTYAMMTAIGEDPMVERILFADRVLLKRAADEGRDWAHKVSYDPGHRDHLHFDVKPHVENANPVLDTVQFA